MDHPHGITRIDTGFFRDDFDAAWLVVENGRAAFVDAGINASLPRLLEALSAKDLGVEAVDWVIPTHVHLDHAGGVGQLMRHLPKARLAIHPRGAAHMIDPTKLIAGASAVYGADEVHRTYGDILPVPAERVVEAPDGFTIELAGRALVCIDTPGHARHHFCVWDARSRSFFTGDTFGLSYREFDTANGAFILPTTSPSQFDPGELCASIDRLCSFEPEAMLLTHYGRVTGVAHLADDLRVQIEAMAAIAREYKRAPDRHERIKSALAELYVSRALEHGVDMTPSAIRERLAMDIELNAQGLAIWVDR